MFAARLAGMLITAVLGLLASGVLIGGSLQPVRVVVLLTLPFSVMFSARRRTRGADLMSTFLVLAFVWLGWGAVSLTWGEDPIAGLREIAALSVGFLTAFTIMQLSRSAQDGYTAIRRGWVVAFCLTLPMAIFEFVTDKHFGANLGGQVAGGTGDSIYYAAASFGNRNTYCAFITLCFPFLLWAFTAARGASSRVFHAGLVGVAVALVAVNASRLGAAVIGIQSAGWIFLSLPPRNVRRTILVRIVFILVILSILFLYVFPKLDYTRLRFETLMLGQDDSVSARTELTLTGVDMLVSSYGIGVGAGNFGQSAGKFGRDLAGLKDPHNLWIEVFSQYGVLVGGLFLLWLAHCARTLVRGRRRVAFGDNRETRIAAGHALLVLLGLPCNALMNSHYIGYTFLWAAIGSVAGTGCIVSSCVTGGGLFRSRPRASMQLRLPNTDSGSQRMPHTL